jgi:hypothetical protein
MKRILWIAPAVVLLAMAVGKAPGRDTLSGVVAHEWGTFTSIAGVNGLAVEWAPAGGADDLPCFVDSVGLKAFFRGTVRMETPVVYFYSDSGRTVDVRVDFPGGALTEWYPQRSFDPEWPLETLEWVGVRVRPNLNPQLPVEPGKSHYYAARETDAAPVVVGSQTEKFLFYRGVGRFEPPLAAAVDGAGNVDVRNLSGLPVAGLVLFENRGGAVGFTAADALGETIRIERPPLDADLPDLRGELRHLLVASGLYAPEAEAMLETWRDSWFEEGARLLYIVPEALVDELLPLEIDPEPLETRRVFVGRMELVTPATLDAVERAIRSDDRESLRTYERFLEPIRTELIRTGRFDERNPGDWIGTDWAGAQARRCG